MTWGKGKWPSLQTAQFMSTGLSLYGLNFPMDISYPSVYGSALLYADMTQNEGKYLAAAGGQMTSEPVLHYVTEMQKSGAKPLEFTFYVPLGFESVAGKLMPNVVATDDPAKIMTVWFKNGQEVWGEI